MSQFYTEIAKYYDDIFSTGNQQLELISQTTGQPPKDILDVACGSGGYSKSLSDMGYSLTAIDLDEKMVQSLKQKDDTINAQVLNMLHINELSGVFDTIFCIGNSLVHLNDQHEVGLFLSSCKNKLKTNGKLILQIVNYDRILAKDIKSLPTIQNDAKGLRFERHYTYLPTQHKVDFMTVLRVQDEVLENHVFLYPITSAQLHALLVAAGFHTIAFYGSFKKDTYESLESFSFVVVAN